MFTHLHTHSYFSFLYGLSSPAELVQAAAANGMKTLALTDAGFLSGAIEFYEACLSANIKPILGLEVNVGLPPKLLAAPPHAQCNSLIFLAMDLKGWSNLSRISSHLYRDPDSTGTPSIPFERLEELNSSLICLTGGRHSLAAQWILEGNHTAAEQYIQHLIRLFPNRLYLEIHAQTEQDAAWVPATVALSRRLHIPLAATNPVLYIRPEQARLARLATALRLNQPLMQIPEHEFPAEGMHFASEKEISVNLRKKGGADIQAVAASLAATLDITGRCNLDLPLGKHYFPAIQQAGASKDTPRFMNETEVHQQLIEHASIGAQRIYGSRLPEIQSRLDYELQIIAECGYSSLFLIMEEIVQFARREGVPISSRGSAASSLVAHCLGITTPDPIRHNLYFERFLNPARTTPPDIDTDLCSRRRDSVIRFVYERFGPDRVAMVSTINRFRRRSALREVLKAYGLQPKVIKEWVERLPHHGHYHGGPPPEAPFAEVEGLAADVGIPTILQEAQALIGIPRHLSVHPGGVIISPGPMTELVPTQLASKGVIVTQFDLESVEKIGLVKIDLLGIRGLTVLGDVADSIYKTQPTRYATPIDALEAIPEEDPETAELVRTGRTIGCFQIESPGVRATLKEIQAKCADDIMAAIALYRPGPLMGGLKDSYVRRHRKLEPITQLHPALTPLLADTYGVVLYQEQVLRIAHELAGLSLADSDLLRRAMSHFDPGKQMEKLKQRFIEGAYAKSGVPEMVAAHIWELVAAFAGYGFPKAHAASYGQAAWRAAWCKVHYPAVFMAAVLANWGGFYSQRVYLTEARRLGLPTYPPHVNYARPEFSVHLDGEQPVLYMGLNQVKDLTHRTQERILRERPYNTFHEFLAKVDPRPVEVQNLIECGAFTGLGSIPSLLRQIRFGGWQGGQLTLFSLFDEPEEEWSLEHQLKAQEEILGASVSLHPLELHANRILASRALTTVDVATQIGQKVRVAGMRQTWRRSYSQREGWIYFMSLEDLEGMLEVVISSDVYQRSRKALSSPGPYLVEGEVTLDRSGEETRIRASRIELLK